MDNPIAICVDRNPFDSIDELVAAIAGIGFAAVEWFEIGAEAPWSAPETAAQLRLLLRRYELTPQFHAPYEGPFDLGRDGEAPRAPDSVARVLSEVLDKADRLGARMTTIHLGTLPPGVDRTEGLRNVMEGILRTVPELEQRHMRLALENHTPAILDGPLGDRPEEFDWLMENVRSDWVGRTLDIGHAHINGHIEDFLARPLDRTFNLHLHDNDGVEDQHLPLGAGTAPWDAVLCRIARACYGEPITLEFFAGAEDYLEAIRRIRSCK